MSWLEPALEALRGGVEFAGALMVVGYCVAALVTLARRRTRTAAQALVAEGALMGLSFKLAAALLKTLELASWNQIATFAVILLLRTLLKRVFQHERQRALARLVGQAEPEARAQA